MQLREVQRQFNEVSVKAMDIAGQQTSAVPDGKVLALPKDLMAMLVDIGLDLRNLIEASLEASRYHTSLLPVMEQIEQLEGVID